MLIDGRFRAGQRPQHVPLLREKESINNGLSCQLLITNLQLNRKVCSIKFLRANKSPTLPVAFLMLITYCKDSPSSLGTNTFHSPAMISVLQQEVVSHQVQLRRKMVIVQKLITIFLLNCTYLTILLFTTKTHLCIT